MCANERVLPDSLPEHAEDGGDGRVSLDLRHVTALAAKFARIIAIQPFEVRHLFREGAGFLATRRKRRGVQRVAGGAKRGIVNMSGFRGAKTSGGGLHNVPASVVNDERTVLRMIILGPWSFYDEAAVEAFAGAKLFFSDLVAYRTRDAVFG